MPLSSDDIKRDRQLANLRRGAGDAAAGNGNGRAVTHGSDRQQWRAVLGRAQGSVPDGQGKAGRR